MNEQPPLNWFYDAPVMDAIGVGTKILSITPDDSCKSTRFSLILDNGRVLVFSSVESSDMGHCVMVSILPLPNV